MGLISIIKYQSLADKWIRRNPLFYFGFKKKLDKINNFDKAQRIAHTDKMLKRILKIAAKSKFARFRNLNSLKLSNWPFLTKELVRDHANDLVTSSKKLSIRASTSGSTGIPIELYRSISSVAHEQAAIDYVCEYKGIDLAKEVVGLFRGDVIKDVNEEGSIFHKKISAKRIVFSSSHLSKSNIDHFYNALIEEKVTVLLGYPSAIEELFRFLNEGKFEIDLLGIVTSSEVLSLSSRELFKKVCPEVQIVDYYGLAERMIFSYSYDGLQHCFLFGYAHVELKFENSDLEFDYYEPYGTSFINDKMPFVRYSTGDLIKVKKGTSKEIIDEICLGMKPFEGIEGRTVDYLMTASNDRLVGMTFIPRGVNNIYRLQIRQVSSTHVDIFVLKKANFSLEDENKILANARLKIPLSMEIKVKVVEKLMTNKSGKTPYVIHDF